VAGYRVRGTKSSVLVGIAVASVHVLAGIYFVGPFQGVPRSDPVRAIASAIIASVIEQPNDMDVVPMPEVKLTPVRYDVSELTQVRFEDAEQGDVGGVVATASAPRLTETCAQVCDPSRFAASAGLTPGQTVTVVLVIEVKADGSTGSTDVAKTSGNSAADAAAIQYARSLHWIPGTKDRQALSMRIRFPVTLVRATS
jgi:TonB family protein